MLAKLVPILAVTAALAVLPLGSGAAELNPRIEVSGGKSLKGPTVLVPTVLVNLSVDGTTGVPPREDSTNVRPKGTFVVAGLEKSFVQELAAKVQQDLVERLRIAGFTVLTYDDIKDDPLVIKLTRRDLDSSYALPYRDDRTMPVHHLIATPSDAQAFKPSSQGPLWTFKAIAKARNAVVLVPEYWIAAPQTWGETENGYPRAAAEIHLSPGLNVSRATAWFLNPRTASGTIKLIAPLDSVAEEVGTLAPIGAESTELGTAQRPAVAWSMKIDPAAYASAVLRGTSAFNRAVTHACVEENPDPAAAN